MLNRDLQGSLPFPVRVFSAFDTRNVICADAPDALLDEAVAECLRLHRVFDRFSSESEVSCLNRSAARFRDCGGSSEACRSDSGDSVGPLRAQAGSTECLDAPGSDGLSEAGFSIQCGDDNAALLHVSLALFEESGGAFNPALGPVCDLWDFKSERFCAPGKPAINAALELCDFRQVGLAPGNLVRIPLGMRLDFGGIAKGYAAERACMMLANRGATCGFVNFGGTVCVLGPKPDGQAWAFGLQQDAAAYGQDAWAILDAREGAFATSAAYYRGADCDGVRFHHIIDPRTGFSVRNGVAEVTAHCASATLADALSTALFVMGPDEGLPFARSLGAGALFRMEDGTVRATAGFPVRVIEGNGGEA